MAFTNLDRRFRLKHSTQASKSSKPIPVGRDSSGIALFMVLSAVSVLAILVGEFSYIAQVGQMIAYGGMDQTKTHYMAKGALKLSLLRLKAFQQVNLFVSKMGGGAGGGASMVPKGLLDKIWQEPLFFPIPTNIPGISAADKDGIEKFQKQSEMEGKFSALIESESSKYNLNLLLPGFMASPTPTGTTTPETQASGTPPAPPVQGGAQTFTAEGARENLKTYLATIVDQKILSDPDFSSQYRDLRMDDIMDNISGWVDRKHEMRTNLNVERIGMKGAPFYSLSELHMIPTIDDDLYALFSPTLTVSTTGGINVNTINETVLRAFLPMMTKDEVKEFFKYRDSTEQDNLFKKSDEFFRFLQNSVAALRSEGAINNLKKDLTERGIVIITDEKQFKITVQAMLNSSTTKIEAWVTLEPTDAAGSIVGGGGGGSLNAGGVIQGGGGQTFQGDGQAPPRPSTGLRITYMKIN